MVYWKHKLAGLFFFIVFAQQAIAQYTVRFVATVPPVNADIYLTGSFNNWDPGDPYYKLSNINNRQYEITLYNLKAGSYQYRFSHGSATTLECSSAGINIQPRVLVVERDTTVHVNVAAWADMYFAMNNLPDSILNEAMMERAGYYVDINLDSSYKYALQLYQLAQKLNLPIKEARALDLQASIFTRQGNAEKALELLFKSLAIKKSLNDSAGGTAFVYFSIATIYDGQQDFTNAKENYNNAINWLNKANERYKAAAYAALGKLYLNKNIDSASSYANKAFALTQQYDVLLLLGNISERNGDYSSALKNYKNAVIESSRGTPGSPFYRSPVEAYKSIAQIFDGLQQQDSAFLYARKAFAIAKKVNNPAAIVSTGAVLVNLFKKTKNFDSAFVYQELLMQKKDSLFTEEKERQIRNIYFNEKLRQQVLEAGNAKQAAKVKIYALIGVAVLLILIGFGYRIRVKNKFNKQLAEIEMRALRAQMNPHFIFNCLASINRYIVKSDTKTASSYLTKFSKLIRLILDNSSNEMVSMDAEIKTLQLYLDMESLRFDDAFEYEIETGKLLRTDNTAIPAMIIQPYIENAIWHGLLNIAEGHFDNGKKGKLWLRFTPLNDDRLQVEIEDNGIGRKKAAELRSKDTIKTKSYGMQISKDRIDLINSQYPTLSSVTIEDLADETGKPSGTKVILQLPVIEMAMHPNSIKKAV